MSDPSSQFLGAEKLTSIFGRWPPFHDAEVLELHFWRGHIDTDANIYDFPVLTAKIHLWLITSALDPKGYFILTKHTLVTIKFSTIDNFKMEAFHHQNALFGLNIDHRTRTEGPSPYFTVAFDPSFGIDASFTCLRIEITEALPCDHQGNPSP
jgi:hypothetical protein